MEETKLECPICKELEDKYWLDKYGMCYWCNQKKAQKHWKERTIKETIEKGESNNEDIIICPYCGYENSNDDLHETTDTYCDGCDKMFHLDIEWTPSYSTSKLEEKEE
jgi:wobble nucleotide-excising tRNase